MAIYSYTLDELVERCCKLLLHDWTGGTTTEEGSTSTIKDLARQEATDHWNSKGAYIYIRDGDEATHWAKVTDFAVSDDPAYGTITFAPLADAAVASGVAYSLHTEFPRDEVVDAINLAIDRVAEEALFWIIDETSIELVANQYEYDLPTNLMFLCRVTMADALATGWVEDTKYSLGDIIKPTTYAGYWYTCTTKGTSNSSEPSWGTTIGGTTEDNDVVWTCRKGSDFYGAPIPPDQYKIIYGATPKIHFIQTPGDTRFEGHEVGRLWAESHLTAGYDLRIEGLGAPATLDNDSSVCPIDPNYVIYQAAAMLHASRTRGTENDPDDNYKQMSVCQAQANEARARVVKVQLPPNSKRVRE